MRPGCHTFKVGTEAKVRAGCNQMLEMEPDAFPAPGKGPALPLTAGRPRGAECIYLTKEVTGENMGALPMAG